MMASGKEPDYKELSKKFLNSIDVRDKTYTNNYYQEWKNYMYRYYPEWAAYPAFIWRGWGYISNVIDNSNKEDSKDNNSKEDTQNDISESIQDGGSIDYSTPSYDSTSMGDMGGGDM